jgi:hypothetical protein
MNDRKARTSSSTAVIIAVVVVVLLAVPCLLAVGLFGAGIFVYRTQEAYQTELDTLLEEPPTPASEPVIPVRSAPITTETDGK